MTPKYLFLLICVGLLVSIACASDSGVNVTTTFSGSSTWQNYTIVDMVTSSCPHSTSTIYGTTGTVIACYNQTNVDDQSYMATTTGYTASGNIYETSTVWFRKVASPIAGLSPEFALFIALFIMMFTALMAGSSTAPAVSLVVTFEGWVMWGMNMFVAIDSAWGSEVGSTIVPQVLIVMTIITIVWLFVEYRRKGK